jgi:hypothetical protein
LRIARFLFTASSLNINQYEKCEEKAANKQNPKGYKRRQKKKISDITFPEQAPQKSIGVQIFLHPTATSLAYFL